MRGVKVVLIALAALAAIGIYLAVSENCEPIRIARVIEIGGCR